jgi:hypothetical protein
MIAISDIKKDRGNEMAAMILCCRVFFETATITDLNDFIAGNDIDWLTLVRLAYQHRIRPVVYKILHLIELPGEINVLIYKQHAEITKLNFKQAVETERIIMLLKQHGIEAIPYKGTAFAKQFFGDLVSRESSDIDLVIKPHDINTAIAVLEHDEYLPELDHVYKYLGAKYHTYYKDYNVNKFKNGKREFHIELHWAIAEGYLGISDKINAFIFDVDDTIVLTKNRIRVLNKAAHFSSILIHHGVKDTFRSLKCIVDIVQASGQVCVQSNSRKIYESFADIGLKNTLAVGNALSEQLFGIGLMQTEVLKVSDSTVNYFYKQLLGKQILRNENTGNIAVWIKKRFMLQDSIFYKLNFCWSTLKYRFIPGPVDFELIQLPKSIFFIYYIMKPFRSIIKPMDVVGRKKKLIPRVTS